MSGYDNSHFVGKENKIKFTKSPAQDTSLYRWKCQDCKSSIQVSDSRSGSTNYGVL